jgi:hypothetical protein
VRSAAAPLGGQVVANQAGEGDSRVFYSCLAATPTEHAAVLSVVDDSSPTAPLLSLVELAADRSVAQRVTLPYEGRVGAWLPLRRRPLTG